MMFIPLRSDKHMQGRKAAGLNSYPLHLFSRKIYLNTAVPTLQLA